MLSGNEAICEGAIQAGCYAFYGYPITPQNEIPAYFAKRMLELGRLFLQAESEISAINMAFGTALTGKRTLTTSSSPGISLKQECISYIAANELPVVIANIQRGGPGLGNISGAQGDYFQTTKGGGHGDYKLITLAPYSVQEMYDLTMLAFDLADKYLNPVMVLADGYIGQLMEPLAIKPYRTKEYDKNWILDGCKGREPRKKGSLLMGRGELEKHVRKLERKYNEIEEKEVRYEVISEDSKLILVAYGIAARISKEVLSLAKSEGVSIGLFRLITLWPFPSKVIHELCKKVERFLVIELSLGQMVEDVKLAVNGKREVYFYGRPGGSYITPEEVWKFIKDEGIY